MFQILHSVEITFKLILGCLPKISDNVALTLTSQVAITLTVDREV